MAAARAAAIRSAAAFAPQDDNRIVGKASTSGRLLDIIPPASRDQLAGRLIDISSRPPSRAAVRLAPGHTSPGEFDPTDRLSDRVPRSAAAANSDHIGQTLTGDFWAAWSVETLDELFASDR